jgi:hypothetical protein
MSDIDLNNPILPLLKPTGWGSNFNEKAISFAYSNAFDPENELALKIVYGINSENCWLYPESTSKEEDVAVATQAMQNLYNDRQSYSDFDTFELDEGSKGLVVAGTEYSSSVILLKPFRTELWKSWNIATDCYLLAAVPSSQCVIFAATKNFNQFIDIARVQYEIAVSENDAPLSPLVHVFDMERLVGVMRTSDVVK